MTAATVGANGALTIPPEVLIALGLQDGDRLELVLLDDEQCLLVPLNRSVTELRGMFGKPARPVSIGDMNDSIANQGGAAQLQR